MFSLHSRYHSISHPPSYPFYLPQAGELKSNSPSVACPSSTEGRPGSRRRWKTSSRPSGCLAPAWGRRGHLLSIWIRTPLLAASRVTSWSPAKAEITGQPLCIRLTWNMEAYRLVGQSQWCKRTYASHFLCLSHFALKNLKSEFSWTIEYINN